MALWWRQGTMDTCSLPAVLCTALQPVVKRHQVLYGRAIKSPHIGFRKLPVLVCVMLSPKNPQRGHCSYFAKSNLKRFYSHMVVKRAGNIVHGSFSINSAAIWSAGMSSEADWNTIQGCGIQSLHHHKFICSLCLATKTTCTVSGRKDTTDTLFTFLNSII